MNYNNLCYRCFAENPSGGSRCPTCGHRNDTPQISTNCMPKGTLLNNRYIVGVALGVGGFGITYKCFDTAMGAICAIKEYFPLNYAQRDQTRRSLWIDPQKLQTYNKIMSRFVDEAKLLRTFKHPNIIGVYDQFFANNTAYYVMEYCDGIDLRRYTDDFKNKLTYDDGINIMYQVMRGMKYIHNKGVLHRDIAPDNIYITKNNTVKILDFGSARHENDQINRSLSVIVKAGYAPIEQYSSAEKQGPYTDVYAFGATFYHLFTGVMPVESTQRILNDELVPFSRLRPDLPKNLKDTIEASLHLKIDGRIQNFGDMMKMMDIVEDPPKKPVNSERREEKPAPAQLPIPMSSATITQRLIAYMVDATVYGAIYSVVVLLLAPDDMTSIYIWSLFPLFLFIINTFTELVAATTLGKALMGLKVCDRYSEKPLISQVIARNLIKIPGIISLLFSKNGKLLEDRVTTSVVCVK